MTHQNFEKYAKEKPMNGNISNVFMEFFKKNIEYKNKDLVVLDFGCGDGKYFSFFKQYFKESNIYGADISQIRIDRCKNIGWSKIQKINSMEKLPFEDNFFDFINLDQVIEHIQKEEVDFYLNEMRRILKTDGKILVITPNYPIKRLCDFAMAAKLRKAARLKDDPTHVTLFNFKKLKKVFIRFSHTSLYPTGGIFYKYIPINFFSHKIIGIIKK